MATPNMSTATSMLPPDMMGIATPVPPRPGYVFQSRDNNPSPALSMIPPGLQEHQNRLWYVLNFTTSGQQGMNLYLGRPNSAGVFRPVSAHPESTVQPSRANVSISESNHVPTATSRISAGVSHLMTHASFTQPAAYVPLGGSNTNTPLVRHPQLQHHAEQELPGHARREIFSRPSTTVGRLESALPSISPPHQMVP
jgi:hypothetical protein